MSLTFKLEVFEGPLDLLLHLVEKNKVDIYDIPIVIITEQYLEYIKELDQEDMESCSEFLLMAATLLDIKCKMLLPRETKEDGEEIDPRAELVEKLLEYKMYKYMSFELKDLSILATKHIFKAPSLPQEVISYKQPIDYEYLIGDTNLTKLNQIFRETMKRREDKIDPIRSKFGNIEKEEVKLEEKESFIKNFLWEKKKCYFRELLNKSSSKLDIIVSFLVILELIKTGLINIDEDKSGEDFFVTIAKGISNEAFFSAEIEGI